MRKSLLALAVALLAVVLAACSSPVRPPAPSAASAAPSAAPRSPPRHRPPRRRPPTPAPRQASPCADRRDLHDRHRQPGLPAVLRRERRRQQDRAVGARRPDQRRGLRERGRLRHRRPARLRQGRGHLDRRPVRELVRARPEDLRHRPQPGLVQRRAAADRRPVRRLLLRQPVARRAQGQPDRVGDDHRRAQGLHVRRPGRHDQLRRDQHVIEPTTEPQVYDTNDAAIQALGQADRRRRRRPADRRLHHERPARQLDDRRASSTRGTPEHFSAVLAKDSPLTACVNARDRRAERRRHAREPRQPVPGRSQATSRSSRRSRRRGPPTVTIRSERPAAEARRGRLRSPEIDRGHRRAWRPSRSRSPARSSSSACSAGSSSTPPAGRRSRSRSSTPRSSPSPGRLIVAAFFVNIQLFVVGRAPGPAASACSSPSCASLPGPVFFPVRLLATVYVDIFRALPGILVIFVLGFGIPGAGPRRHPEPSPIFYAVLALTLVYSAYVSEVYRAGIESVHPSQDAAARSLGLSRSRPAPRRPPAGRPARHPAAAERLHRAPEGHGARVVHRRRRDLPAGRRSSRPATFNFTPYMAVALVFIVVTIPLARLTDWLVARDRRRRRRARR